jgi:hypothetical protein
LTNTNTKGTLYQRVRENRDSESGTSRQGIITKTPTPNTKADLYKTSTPSQVKSIQDLFPKALDKPKTYDEKDMLRWFDFSCRAHPCALLTIIRFLCRGSCGIALPNPQAGPSHTRPRLLLQGLRFESAVPGPSGSDNEVRCSF